MKKFQEDFSFMEGKKEVIDGVTVIHTGMTLHYSGFNYEPATEEYVEMYDSNGNRFYSNFESMEEANEKINELAKEGITAVIGPKAPWKNYITGLPVPNRSKTQIGLYIVPTQEKKEGFALCKSLR